MAKRRKHWTEMSPEEVDAAAANEEGAMSMDAARSMFAAENARVAQSPEYKRLMAVPDHLELTDAEFYAKAGVSEDMQWQKHIVEDDRDVVLGRVARQQLRRFEEMALVEQVSIDVIASRFTVSEELQPFLDKELAVYTAVTFSPYYDSMSSQLEGELNYNFVREVA